MFKLSEPPLSPHQQFFRFLLSAGNAEVQHIINVTKANLEANIPLFSFENLLIERSEESLFKLSSIIQQDISKIKIAIDACKNKQTPTFSGKQSLWQEH